MIAPADLGILQQQRGLLLLRAGRMEAALRLLDVAVPALAQAGESVVLARTLLNRGVLHLAAGRVRLARADLDKCGEIARAHGLDVVAAKATHNVGCCQLLCGDVPAALRSFDTAARSLRALGAHGMLAVSALDHARALLAAGLDRDAGQELEQAIALFRRQRLSQDHAEAELARAQAALAAGDLEAARLWSGRASRRFVRRGNHTWAALAGLTQVRVGLAFARSPVRLAGRALRLTGELRALGLHHDAEAAHLLSVRALLAAGRPEAARHRAGSARQSRPGAPIEVRLLRRLTRAELCLSGGGRGAALAQLRTGLSELQGYRSRFGSVDLQSGVATLGVELASAGLAQAWDSGSPVSVFGWSERSRAQAFRIRPVRPPTDPQTADALAELRRLRRSVRDAQLSGRREPRAAARCAELERWIEHRGRQLDGTGQSQAVVSYPQVRARLAETGRAMVSYLVRGDRLHALVLAGGSARLVGLDGYPPVAEAVRRLLGDLEMLANTRLPDRLAEVVRASARSRAVFLDNQLVVSLLPHTGERDLVLLPTRLLCTVPWGLLPALRGRPVTVAPSASAWSAALTRAADPAPGAPLLVAGPDLRYADAEVAGIQPLHPTCRTLRGTAATTEATLKLMDAASMVHLAAHGHHDAENSLFSRLDLVDGPLMAHDLQRLGTAPSQVVLSACDVGRAVVRAGDEILGLTAAFLYAGTANVIASVARIPDRNTAVIMRHYHRRVAAGEAPARALAASAVGTPFVCFGAG
jgi:tetratricopeptide (TPR) repeat protein